MGLAWALYQEDETSPLALFNWNRCWIGKYNAFLTTFIITKYWITTTVISADLTFNWNRLQDWLSEWFFFYIQYNTNQINLKTSSNKLTIYQVINPPIQKRLIGGYITFVYVFVSTSQTNQLTKLPKLYVKFFPFSATIVALNFTPISDSMGHCVELQTSLALSLDSLFISSEVSLEPS